MGSIEPLDGKGNTQEPFRYYAFISYSHSRSDMKWAKRLQRKLENYRLPSFLIRQLPHLPKSLRPIFRDQTDLGVTHLEHGIREELKASRYLIVICSPKGAESEWVNKEVQDFIAMGREGSIIPFIVDGEPHSTDKQRECYPPALRQVPGQVLGASIQELGWDRAFVRVVAAMLQLKFDQLWQRHRRRERMKQAMIAAVIAVLAVASGLWWDHTRLKTTYYEDYVTRWSIPEGVRPLSKALLKHREASWRIETKRGRVLRVVCVNSADRSIAPPAWYVGYRPSDQRFSYREDGKLEHVDLHAPNSKLLAQSKYGNLKRKSDGGASRVVSYIADEEGLKHQYFVASGTGPQVGPLTGEGPEDKQKSNIAKVLLTYNPEGLIVREKFFDPSGNPAAERNKIFGRSYTYDGSGRLLRIEFLDDQSERMRDSGGLASIAHEYDDHGRLTQTGYFSIDGALIYNDEDSVAKKTLTYDPHGNAIKIEYHAPNGDRCLHQMKFAVVSFMLKFCTMACCAL